MPCHITSYHVILRHMSYYVICHITSYGILGILGIPESAESGGYTLSDMHNRVRPVGDTADGGDEGAAQTLGAETPVEAVAMTRASTAPFGSKSKRAPCGGAGADSWLCSHTRLSTRGWHRRPPGRRRSQPKQWELKRPQRADVAQERTEKEPASPRRSAPRSCRMSRVTAEEKHRDRRSKLLGTKRRRPR